MSWTSNLLVIAHRTIDSEYLLETLIKRSSAGPIKITLLVPAHTSRMATSRRLDRATRRLEAADITVEAIVGHPDPIVALDEVWRPYRFDEIIVATLPDRRSGRRWLSLPNRIERFTGVPVTHIVAPVWQSSIIPRMHA
ncbi:MAG TPA: hypothetical protein VNA28_18100 [Solirubrobacteraceae bacterium]|nr:hypothetical protein [Solirubrobacteraceae bacterium]